MITVPSAEYNSNSKVRVVAAPGRPVHVCQTQHVRTFVSQTETCDFITGLSPRQESVTDYTAPSSSLADSVPTGGTKMEESLVANVSRISKCFC